MLALETIANKSKVLVPSTFSGYDYCINPYVGCQFGCSYCYVRYFVKDKNAAWGEFVRIRDHIKEALPRELRKNQLNVTHATETTTVVGKDGKNKTVKSTVMLPINNVRLVFGTMTDPYQPAEVKHRITRTALEILTRDDTPDFKKVGIFTRSPLVLQDIELIKKLPKARVHFTISPFSNKIMRALEPYSPTMERRWDVVKKLKDAGVRVHVNVSPVMPIISEELVEDWIKKLTSIAVDEYFVDSMQPYSDSFESFKKSCQHLSNWDEIETIMKNRELYGDWKFKYFQTWNEIRKVYQHLAPDQLPIWSDHQSKTWVNFQTGQSMSKRLYGDDLVDPETTN